jgi:transcriptional regulator GlxA family with amidase domain
LLDGVKATTNWKVIGKLREAGVEVVEERYVHDGKVWSSGGVSAGIDMLLAFIAHEADAKAAWVTQYQSEYLPEGRLYGPMSEWDGAPAYARRLG